MILSAHVKHTGNAVHKKVHSFVASAKPPRYNEYMKIKELFHTHQYKIIIGAPIIFLFLINAGAVMGAGNVFSFKAEKSAFVTVGENVPVHLLVTTKVPVNAVGGTVLFPHELLSIESIARSASVVDLWSEEPSFSNETGTLSLSGGVLPEHNENGLSGNVITVTFRARDAGKAVLSVKDGQLLAADGVGTNVISGSTPFTLFIRNADKPSPDVNDDGVLSVGDVNSLYLKTFRPYDARYDLNGDKKVSWADVMELISLL